MTPEQGIIIHLIVFIVILIFFYFVQHNNINQLIKNNEELLEQVRQCRQIIDTYKKLVDAK